MNAIQSNTVARARCKRGDKLKETQDQQQSIKYKIYAIIEFLQNNVYCRI